MDADLTCPPCKGSGWRPCPCRCGKKQPCPQGCTEGRRCPTLAEWDALRAERDRYRGLLQVIAAHPVTKDPYAIARATLDAEETP